MTKSIVEGGKVELFKPFIEDPVPIATVLNNRLTAERLGEDEGYPLVHFIFKSPFPAANRSTIFCHYSSLEEEDGSYIILESSRGNEE